MSLFLRAMAAAFEARAATGGGPEYAEQARAAIAGLEAETGERLSPPDWVIVLGGPFGGEPADAGLRDPAYEAALLAQAVKEAGGE